MKLPKIGASVVVFWEDIVSQDAWQDTPEARRPPRDHDFMESPGRFLGVGEDDRLQLAQTSGFLDGTVTRCASTYYIPMGAVVAIVPCPFPPNPPRRRRRER